MRITTTIGKLAHEKKECMYVRMFILFIGAVTGCSHVLDNTIQKNPFKKVICYLWLGHKEKIWKRHQIFSCPCYLNFIEGMYYFIEIFFQHILPWQERRWWGYGCGWRSGRAGNPGRGWIPAGATIGRHCWPSHADEVKHLSLIDFWDYDIIAVVTY